MSRIHVTISTDGLAAEASADAGSACTRDQVLTAITGAGLTDGIDDVAVAHFVHALASLTAVPATVVARGKPAAAGVDGNVIRTFDSAPLVGRPGPEGRIDYRERDLLHPAAEGDIVGCIVEPTPGVAGFDVRGRKLEPEAGKPHTVRLGAGVHVDGHHVLAVKNGVVVQNARALDVVDAWQHSGDVDLKSGNLHTKGSLSVQGEVRDGFRVDAGGDIVINGAVQRGFVGAGASVHVAAGVLDGSIVKATANITARHATSSRLEAGLDVELGDEATHSFLRAENIRLPTGRGAAFGGELRARGSISLVAAGTTNGARTLLSVADITDESADLVRATNLDDKAQRVAARPKRELPGPRGKAARSAMKGDDRSQQQRLQLAQRQRSLLQKATIEIKGALHPGVRIQFGDATVVVDAEKSHVRFRWDAQTNQIIEETLP